MSLNFDLIRKLASLEAGRQYLEDPKEDSLEAVYQSKLASADDRGLLAIASRLPGDLIENYELLGGTYKEAASLASVLAAPAGQALGKVVEPAAAAAKRVVSTAPKALFKSPATAAGPVSGLTNLKAVHTANRELGGAQSLLGAQPARGLHL
jgi:hypothetical protein